LVFRLDGKKYCTTLNTDDETEAERIKATAERTLSLIAEGRVAIPAGANVGLFVATDGWIAKERTTEKAPTMGSSTRSTVRHPQRNG
jgi:hypothetical protein